MNRERLQEKWGERSWADRLRIYAGAAFAVVIGIALLATMVPAAGVVLLGALVVIPAFLLLRGRSLGVSGPGQRLRAFLTKLLTFAGGLVIIGLLFANSPILGIAAAVAGVVILFVIQHQRQRKEHERRMLPNRREVIEVSLSPGEGTSELQFQDIFHRLSTNADSAQLSQADRRETRGVLSTVLIADRPDPHGQVRLRAYLEGHEDANDADDLETLVQASFAGDATVTPVDVDAYPPFVYAEQWRQSQDAEVAELNSDDAVQ